MEFSYTSILLPCYSHEFDSRSNGARVVEETKAYRFPSDAMKAADAGSRAIARGRRGRLLRPPRRGRRRKAAERRCLAGRPRRRRVLLPAATLLHN